MVYFFETTRGDVSSPTTTKKSKKLKGKSFTKENSECEDTMVGQQKNIDFKTQKRRRRSLDESLINPIKAFVGSTRNRRQSTTDAVNFQRSSIFYNSDRRRKRSENDLFARFQDTTKERIRTAATRSTSFKENESPVKKHTPTMLRRISRHLIRQAYSDAENRNSISELPNESDETQSNDSPMSRRHFGKSFDKGCDTSSLSTNDSGIDSRDDKIVSSDEHSNDGDFVNLDRDKILSAPPVTLNRSLSFNDVTKKLDTFDKTDSVKKPSSVRRNLSLREERLKQATASVSPSPMILRKSNEKLHRLTLQNKAEHCSSDEKISNSTHNKSVRKKKKIFQPIVNRIRKSSRQETAQQQLKLLIIDNARLEQIVSETIRDKMQTLEYDHKQSNDRCRLISTTIEKTLKLRLGAQPGNPEYKVIAIVYIGETRDQGICFATQCSYEPTQDLFATATYQQDNMYVCATVMASLIQNN